MMLIFDQKRLSRSITRKEWQEIWRWKRVTEKKLKKFVEEQIGLLVTYGSTMPVEVRSDIIDVVTNPPLLIYPDVKGTQHFDIRPGAIHYVR